jgi:hypothetical protein
LATTADYPWNPIDSGTAQVHVVQRPLSAGRQGKSGETSRIAISHSPGPHSHPSPHNMSYLQHRETSYVVVLLCTTGLGHHSSFISFEKNITSFASESLVPKQSTPLTTAQDRCGRNAVPPSLLFVSRFSNFSLLHVESDWAGVPTEFSRSRVSRGPRRSAVTKSSQRIYEATSVPRPRPAN